MILIFDLKGRSMRRRTVALALLIAAGCSGSATPHAGVVQVAAAFSPIVEATNRIGGDRVEVTSLTPPGAEPHDVELTPDQIATVLNADVLIYLGGGFQPAVEDLAKRRSGSSVNLLSGRDPHIWLDPVAWDEAVGEIAEALSEADADGREMYLKNLAAYRTELRALDANFRAGLRDCKRRFIVTAHDAFGRLAARYGLEQIPIAGISPEAEPSAKHLAELRRLVRERGVTTIFTETLVSPRVAETLARETGVRTTVLDPIESLGEEDLQAGKTYLSQMLANLKALRKALDCP
jgi:zinc transport system substrate-binding protein